MTGQVGITLPFDDVSLTDHRPLLRSLIDGGYDDVWTGEVNANDGFTPLALFAGWEDGLRVSCAVPSVFTRGPGLLAMTAASLAEIAPGRARFGIGAGSNVIVETWNGVPFAQPLHKVHDTLRFLRQVLSGERADDYETVHGKGFKLARVPKVPPTLVVAALGPKMQELAAAEADGVCLNFLSAADVLTVIERSQTVARSAPGTLETSARLFVIPGEGDAVEAAARRHIAGYLTVPVYTRFQEWLGRGDAIAPLLSAWNGGDRKKATEVIPQEVVDDLVAYGTPAQCAERIGRYFDAGLDAATLCVLPSPDPLPAPARVEFLVDLRRQLTERASKEI